ncbi:MAG: hydratase, partial [Clostridia bacterium]
MPQTEDCGLLRKNTIAWGIFQKHNISGNEDDLQIKFDALASHDITYVGIIQTARASGLTGFSLPYVLTNCHNSLCAVGGTINEDDHAFGLSAARKYGGIFVPAHLAVIHQYMREMMSGCGKMILGSDSHTRYGALGTMAMGEGGPELVKQLLGKSYDLKYPEVCLVYLHGSVKKGVGPQDVALAIIGEVFKNGFVKNKVMEFAGPGLSELSVDFRNGVDVMTTETTCLSSIWHTDEKVREYYRIHEREGDYRELKPLVPACYDGMIDVDLSTVEPMIAMPFHPGNTYTIRGLIENAADIFALVEKDAKAIMGEKADYRIRDKIRGKDILVDQGIIAGCAGGTFENIFEAPAILAGKNPGNSDFSLSVYPQ